MDKWLFLKGMVLPLLLMALLLACIGCVQATRTVQHVAHDDGKVTVTTEYKERYFWSFRFPHGWKPTTYLHRAETWEEEFLRRIEEKPE